MQISMDEELTTQQKLILLEKYKAYTMSEFSIKPELIIQYVELLKEFSNLETIYSLLRGYMDRFIQYYCEITEKNIRDFDHEVIVKTLKLRIILKLIVLILSRIPLYLGYFLENLNEHKFVCYILESLIIYTKKNQSLDIIEYQELKLKNFKVYCIIEDYRSCLRLYKPEEELIVLEDLESKLQFLQNSDTLYQNEKILMSIIESYYLIIVFYFLNDEYTKANEYTNEFYLKGYFDNEDKLETYGKWNYIDLKKIQYIKISLDNIEASKKKVEEQIIMQASNIDINGTTNVIIDVNNEDYNIESMEEENKQEKINTDMNIKSIIPFEFKDLTNEEKIQMLDTLLLKYYSTLDPNIFSSFTKVEESIDTEKLKQDDQTQWLELILSLFIIKKIEQQDIKDIKFNECYESIFEATKICQLPKIQKVKILFYSLSKLIIDDDPKKFQALFIINQYIMNNFITKNNFIDLTNMITHFEKFVNMVNKLGVNIPEQDNIDIAEDDNENANNAKLLVYLQALLIPLIICYELHLAKALTNKENGDYELGNDLPKPTVPEFKKLLGLFWILQRNQNPIIETELTFSDCIMNFIEHTWSLKYLTALQGTYLYLFHVFKETYKTHPEEIESINIELAHKEDMVNIFSDNQIYIFLVGISPEIRDSIKFSNYLEDKFQLTKILKGIHKQFKMIIKREYEKESEFDFTKMCKLEFKFQKNLLKVEIDSAKCHYISLNYKMCAKKLLSCFNIYTYSKVNPFEKLPDIFNKSSLFEMLISTFYKINAFNEALVILQFLEKINVEDIDNIMKKITNFPEFYVELINLPIILEKLFEKFAPINESLMNKLLQRIKNPEVYQTNFDIKSSKIHNFAKIMIIRFAYVFYVERVDMTTLQFQILEESIKREKRKEKANRKKIFLSQLI